MNFEIKRSEENKSYVRPLTNLRLKWYIFRRIYEDEWNGASIPQRQAILKKQSSVLKELI